MKKICITFCVLLILIATVLTAVNFPAGGEGDGQYLRIHVRANSNSTLDQSIKYSVKDDVVQFLTPYVAECTTMERAMSVVSSLEDEIVEVCDEALARLGAHYTSRAEVREEYFPTRVYEQTTLEAGTYEALIVELGEGTGDNWWCVIYPPLCFTSADCDVQYRSLIYDIIDKFFRRG